MAEKLTWHDVLAEEKEKPYFIETLKQVADERAAGVTVYPPQKDVFNAFRLTELGDATVDVLVRGPCHGPQHAHGLAYAVLPGVQVPPSLQNTYKELMQDIPGCRKPDNGFLESWAKQGVMLLNTVLTVEAGKAHSHARFGWETFTDNVIAAINQHCEGVIFLLWGSHAQKKGSIIDRKRHHVLQAPHPSPLSAHRGFFGSKHFSTTNELLSAAGKKPVDWTPVLPE